jgi:hemoglobin
MERPSLYEHAGGMPAFSRLATAHHERCLDDPVLQHLFSHPGDPDHMEHLARYRAEAPGGPAGYSRSCGGHSAMLELHARTQAQEDLGRRLGSPEPAGIGQGHRLAPARHRPHARD